MKHYRHGDVNLHQITNKEWEDVKNKGKRIENKGSFILARSEATGSVHELTADGLEVYKLGGVTYLRASKTGKLTHTHDHETLEIEPLPYLQIPERELDHFADSVIRKIVD